VGLGVLALGVALILTRLITYVAPQLSAANRAIVPQMLWYLGAFGALAALLRLRDERPFWETLDFTYPWPRLGMTLAAGPLTVLVVAVAGNLLHMPAVDNAIEKLLTDVPAVVSIGLFASTLGPLAEELVFRGMLQPLTVKALGPVAGILAASLPFALLHGPQYSWSWQHIALLVFASSVFGVTRQVTRSTAASTFVHGLYNLFTFIGYLSQRKDLFP